ncbi:MAG: AAA family ATPase [Comamonas sp.]|jgi:DNA polymerase III delta prime subunit|uniref:McrB family protein n=1 Tax=Comamonas sp. TaxID=34028 RepID=UPI002838BF16|nr:AAA family ATPase [Comamonas sp.]MDR0215483.1 AAA family ATPase [Comamonas sp.]
MTKEEERTKAVSEMLSAAAAYAKSGRDNDVERETLARAVQGLADPNGTKQPSVYVAKLTPEGVLNQVWQGRSISTDNDLMVLLDQTDKGERIIEAVEGRLAPRVDSGFEAIVIGSPAESGGWDIHQVVEYEGSSFGEALTTLTSKVFPILRVTDPAGIDGGGAKPHEPLPAHGAAPVQEVGLNAQDVIAHLTEAKNVILEGPPGTGKTHLVLQVARELAGAPASCYRLAELCGGHSLQTCNEALRDAPLVWEMVQLHPTYGYDDFVRGLRPDPTAAGFSLRSVDGILPTMARVARIRGERPTLLVIDEINRADLSAVLGETLFAIDPAHRGREVRLMYEAPPDGDDALSVPSNLFLLGTMNTSDRSIGAIDYAVRRRFRFLGMRPSMAAVRAFYEGFPERASAAQTLMDAFLESVDGSDLVPGHTYLLVPGHSHLSHQEWSVRIVARVIYEVLPLLDEYREEGVNLKHAVLQTGTGSIDLLAQSPREAIRDALQVWLNQLIEQPAHVGERNTP